MKPPSAGAASGCGTSRADAVGGGWGKGWVQGSNVAFVGCEQVLELVELCILLHQDRMFELRYLFDLHEGNCHSQLK